MFSPIAVGSLARPYFVRDSTAPSAACAAARRATGTRLPAAAGRGAAEPAGERGPVPVVGAYLRLAAYLPVRATDHGASRA